METGLGQMSREAGGRGGVIVNISSTCGVTCHGDMFATPVNIITIIILYLLSLLLLSGIHGLQARGDRPHQNIRSKCPARDCLI